MSARTHSPNEKVLGKYSSGSSHDRGPPQQLGKRLRMERIIHSETGNLVLVPIDHGISIGPCTGLWDTRRTVENVFLGGATGVIMHKGLIRHCYRGYRDMGLILQLSASTELAYRPDDKRIVTTVSQAVRLGADAVSVHLNLGADGEPEMLTEIGKVSDDCQEWGMPLMVMAYPRGPKIEDSFHPSSIAHVARVAAELGADIIKCSYTGDIDSFRRVVQAAMVPVIIAGGPKMDSEKSVLEMVYDSLQAGGSGVSIGRNVFQHPNVEGMVRAISELVLHQGDVDDAMRCIHG